MGKLTPTNYLLVKCYFSYFLKCYLNIYNLENKGKIDIYYFDENGFTQSSNIQEMV